MGLLAASAWGREKLPPHRLAIGHSLPHSRWMQPGLAPGLGFFLLKVWTWNTCPAFGLNDRASKGPGEVTSKAQQTGRSASKVSLSSGSGRSPAVTWLGDKQR